MSRKFDFPRWGRRLMDEFKQVDYKTPKRDKEKIEHSVIRLPYKD